MAAITIRQLEDSTKTRLRIRAATNGRSMEEEAREILRQALSDSQASGTGMGERIRARFGALGGIDLELPERGPIRTPPDFGATPKRRPKKSASGQR